MLWAPSTKNCVNLTKTWQIIAQIILNLLQIKMDSWEFLIHGPSLEKDLQEFFLVKIIRLEMFPSRTIWRHTHAQNLVGKDTTRLMVAIFQILTVKARKTWLACMAGVPNFNISVIIKIEVTILKGRTSNTLIALSLQNLMGILQVSTQKHQNDL